MLVISWTRLIKWLVSWPLAKGSVCIFQKSLNKWLQSPACYLLTLDDFLANLVASNICVLFCFFVFCCCCFLFRVCVAVWGYPFCWCWWFLISKLKLANVASVEHWEQRQGPEKDLSSKHKHFRGNRECCGRSAFICWITFCSHINSKRHLIHKKKYFTFFSQ